MVDLSVGQVSGIIAAGGYIAQFFIPTVTTLILAGLLSDENSLMTWTQAARAFQSSHWPFLVRTDFTLVGPVSKPVITEALVRPIALFILAVASIVTPLGLYDAVVPGEKMVPTPFGYQSDPSPFGYATSSREDIFFNRKCGYISPVVCPGSDTVISPSDNDNTVDVPKGYDIRVPQNLTDMFQSGLENMASTVSSIFNIEWRSYSFSNVQYINNGSRYPIGAHRRVESLVLRDGYQAIEGLVVNSQDGGIGFRNHSIPAPLQHGGVWTEDLLFVTPNTECVNTNVTVDFTISTNTSNFEDVEDLVITDRGGFSNMNTTYPYYNRSAPYENPDLRGRAFKGAFLFNANTMAFLNVTNIRTDEMDAWAYINSKVGDTYPISLGGSAENSLNSKKGPIWGLHTNLPETFVNASSKLYPNPWNVTMEDYRSITISCQGAAGQDLANMENIGAVCGLILGSPRKVDGPTKTMFEPGSRYSTPLYSCASAAKASIKTVAFRYNGTEGLQSLSIDDIHDKVYESDDAKPLWGVENTTLSLADVQPLWGMVADRYRGRGDLSVVKSESLFLPGWASTGAITATSMYLPGVEFHTHAFGAAYLKTDGDADYAGLSNVAIFMEWSKLSARSDTASQIINRIWTDYAANSVVGNRGWTQSPNNETNHQKRDDAPRDVQMIDVPVKLYHHKVRYHLEYGVPAYIVLAACLVFGTVAFFLFLFGDARPAVVRKHLFHTAVGRIMAAFTYPGLAHPHTETRYWNGLVGGKKVSMANMVPQATEMAMVPQQAHGATSRADDPLLRRRTGTPQ